MAQDQPSSDTPWTEDQWEAFLREGEVRAARYGELLESLMDHPDRDAIIDREMGWNDGPQEGDDELIERLNRAASGEDDNDDEDDDEDDDSDGGSQPWLSIEEETAEVADEDIPLDNEEDVHSIDAYAKSAAVAMRIHHALKPHLNAETETSDEEFGEAFINSQIAVAKIANGHGMGYEDDVICGNIVNCKIALNANTRAAEALVYLRDKDLVAGSTIDPLLAELATARQSIELRISDLRSRVWWDKK